MLSLSDNVLFSTELVPEGEPTPSSWWYFAPETGQHIAFYSLRSLERLAEMFRLKLYSNGTSLHMFSKKQLKMDPFKSALPQGRLKRLVSIFIPGPPSVKRESLLAKDFSFLREHVNANNSD
jgi:hypothetical protein